MFIDASAICAILLCEPAAAALSERICDARVRLTSALTIYEGVTAVARGKDGKVATARRDVGRFIGLSEIKVAASGDAERHIALDAFERCGRGRHPARLNMGDCFAYASARTHGVPMLVKDNDFNQTDIAAGSTRYLDFYNTRRPTPPLAAERRTRPISAHWPAWPRPHELFAADLGLSLRSGCARSVSQAKNGVIPPAGIPLKKRRSLSRQTEPPLPWPPPVLPDQQPRRDQMGD